MDLPLPGYEQYWSYAEKKGYFRHRRLCQGAGSDRTGGAGRPKPWTARGGFSPWNTPGFYLVNCYTPNAQEGLKRLDHRMAWDDAYRAHLMALDQKKPVIACADFNVAHQEIDLKNPGPNRGNAGLLRRGAE